jgi:formamidopyrimidine-DNA glycosylase
MPELPEVETVVRTLDKQITGRKILDINNSWPNHLATHDLDAMQALITGSTIVNLSRRGKYIVFTLDNGSTMLIHLKMTGQLLLQPSLVPLPDHTHTVFTLSGGNELRFRDVRKFGRVHLTSDPSSVLGEIGPEPLSADFTAQSLFDALSARRRILKPLLLDQGFIAGIGNIYADEALHGARILPTRISDTLSLDEASNLHSNIQATLQRAIEKGGATINDYRQPDGSQGEMQSLFRVYGLQGQPCPRGDGIIQRIVLGGRSTFFCSDCQH